MTATNFDSKANTEETSRTGLIPKTLWLYNTLPIVAILKDES